MQKKNLLALVFLATFVFAVIGCDSQKQVVEDTKKTGLSPEERKSKKGD